MGKSKYKVTQPETMTYEQACATALLQALTVTSKRPRMLGWWPQATMRDDMKCTYAIRRLRVRAGLMP